MTLTEVLKTIKMKLDPSKVMDSLEKKASFSEELDNHLDGNNLGEDFKNNPFDKKSTAIRISRNEVEPLIELTDVWKIYQMGETEFAALKGINLEIFEGEFLVVLGPSGSGKSTLMNLLGCLDLPSKGTVFLNSKDISELDESELALIRGQMIGFIFQS
ncbi:MAG: putative transport system ATP-binding protein, partial [Euryarchaeota archaeon]|nr:putative transport system ATP-binding protein [Euryarchaeota archaeon]